LKYQQFTDILLLVKEKRRIKMEYRNEMPFSSYDELVKAVQNGEAKILYRRSTANNLANRNSHIGSLLFGLGAVFGSIILLAFSHFVIHNYWIMLFAIVLFLLNSIVPYIKKSLLLISIVISVLPFIIQKAIWLSAIGLSMIALYIGYEIWWGVVSYRAQSMLLSDKTLFEQVWQSGSIGVKTKDGKLYTHKLF